MTLQVIGAGWGRTGTMSLKLALEQLGYPCHHMHEVFLHPEHVAALHGGGERCARLGRHLRRLYGRGRLAHVFILARAECRVSRREGDSHRARSAGLVRELHRDDPETDHDVRRRVGRHGPRRDHRARSRRRSEHARPSAGRVRTSQRAKYERRSPPSGCSSSESAKGGSRCVPSSGATRPTSRSRA